MVLRCTMRGRDGRRPCRTRAPRATGRWRRSMSATRRAL